MPNNNKIAFITCVNNEDVYSTCLDRINNLFIPYNYEIEIIPIRDSPNICNSYNKAIQQSDAKYKVYLHQDTLIVYINFISSILEIFIKNPDIGMLGVIGCKKIPTNGIWWDSIQKVGRIIESSSGNLKLINYNPSKPIEYVEAVDGLIMITQYDIQWREDLFSGWHFYDISQCIEFKRNNYKIAIPSQSTVWCIHDSGVANLDKYHTYKGIFLEEYVNLI